MKEGGFAGPLGTSCLLRIDRGGSATEGIGVFMYLRAFPTEKA